MKKRIAENFRLKLNEISIPSTRLPKNIVIGDEEKRMIQNVSWNELILSDEGNDGNSMVHMGIKFPWNTQSYLNIVVDIQIINEKLYQPHIFLSDNIQNLGLGYKIYVALINDLGHLYSSEGRRQNKLVIGKILDKLGKESNIECLNGKRGRLCCLHNHPQKDFFIDFLQ